ncbi:uncharacterized protein LOC134214947 [Armigeres subalbatus]|uniref:uncharacterized protein LOC134214947 n=1 Tax=Armigeres subalbatus TaxID=124917 RepID=UPI002ED21AC1
MGCLRKWILNKTLYLLDFRHVISKDYVGQCDDNICLQETYYIPGKGRANPGGKLFSRVNYLKQSERKRDRLEELHIQPEAIKLEEVVSPEVQAALSWLEVNSFPWATVLAQWEVSFPERKKSLRELSKADDFISKYSHLKENCGFQLLDIDYRLLGFGDPNIPVRKWDLCFEPIVKFAELQARDPSAKDLIQLITDCSSTSDFRLLNVLLLLNTVLIPVKASKGFKPTVATAQADTFLLAGSREQAQLEIRKVYEVYERQKSPMCPKLIVIGEDLSNTTGFQFDLPLSNILVNE